jgi:broad specificity phosphatase PhoE
LYIYLVRHGETDWNTGFLFQGQTDIPLNKTGISQAKHIASELKDKEIDVIISSDLLRARRTAEEIRKACPGKWPVKTFRGLRERDYGNFEGKRYDQLAVGGRGFTGEKDKKFFARINRAFDGIMNQYSGKNIVIVTHGGVVRQIVSHVLGLKDYKRLRIYNASLSEIYYDTEKKAFFLLLLNSISHLPAKERNTIQYHIKGV